MSDHEQLRFRNALNELKQFLDPGTRMDVLNSALGLLLSLSADGNFYGAISIEDATDLCKLLANLFTNNTLLPSSRALLFSLFVNMTADNETKEFASVFLNDNKFIEVSLKEMFNESNDQICTIRAIQILSNLSRHFPGRLSDRISSTDPDFILKAIGFLLTNLSTVPAVSLQIAKNKLDLFITLLSPNANSQARMAAFEIVYNLSMQDELHTLLLRDEDRLLSALLAPLADAEDQLDEDEIDKLPPGLQYWEGRRETDRRLLERVLSTLYQLCATRIGREVLRRKGIYALLREFDKTGGQQPAADATIAQGQMLLLNSAGDGQNMDVLRALIGILIRDEEDMGLASRGGQEEVEDSIRHLGTTT